ncbi:MAG: hypothetical protein K2Y27_08935 [Xanthobacteraceae bacterium]|nr:hypothetical protein [Xanthobacteraceae bacterium]
MAIFLSCLVLAALGDAADARRGGRFVSGFARGMAHTGIGSKTYGADTLTVQQLTDCLKRAEALDNESASIESDRNQVQSKFSQVDSLKAELDRSQAMLNRSSQAAIDRFNADVRRYNAFVSEARSTQASFNSKIDQHNATVQTYNAACAKRYYADDLASAKRSLGIE